MKQWTYRKLPCALCQERERIKGGQFCGECRLLCSCCRAKPKSSGHNWCAACRNIALRKRRELVPMTPEQRRQGIARAKVAVAIQRKKLSKLPCQKCGDAKVLAFIPDIDRPIATVIWLCKKHHRLAGLGHESVADCCASGLESQVAHET